MTYWGDSRARLTCSKHGYEACEAARVGTGWATLLPALRSSWLVGRGRLAELPSVGQLLRVAVCHDLLCDRLAPSRRPRLCRMGTKEVIVWKLSWPKLSCISAERQVNCAKFSVSIFYYFEDDISHVVSACHLSVPHQKHHHIGDILQVPTLLQ